jgi:uncharacterized surface protein with fasciclin (FAS1) repeats
MKPLLPPGPVLRSRSFCHPRTLALLAGLSLLLGIGSPLPLCAQVRVAASPSPAVAAKGDLLAVIKAAGKYNTFLKVLDATGLTSTLEQPGPYTVFTPTDEAFAKLPPGTLDRLMKPEAKPKLLAVMNYHIAPGKVTLAALSKMDELKTLNGEEIDVDTSTDGKTIEMDDSKIIGPGMEATNGVAYSVDAVLEP